MLDPRWVLTGSCESAGGGASRDGLDCRHPRGRAASRRLYLPSRGPCAPSLRAGWHGQTAMEKVCGAGGETISRRLPRHITREGEVPGTGVR